MKYYILCNLSSRTYLSNVPMGPYKARETWDEYSCGWYGWQPQGHAAIIFDEVSPLNNAEYAKRIAEKYYNERGGKYALVEYSPTLNRLGKVAMPLTGITTKQTEQ